MGFFFVFLVATRGEPVAFKTLPGTQWRTSKGVVKKIWNNIRFEPRLVPPEAGVEADEVCGPRRFPTLLGKTLAGSILTSARSKLTSASPT